MTKRTAKSKVKRVSNPKPKTVMLRPTEVLKVLVPTGVVPLVATDPKRHEVVIVPVKARVAKKGWWASLFH